MTTWIPPPPQQEGLLHWSPSARADVKVKTYYRINGELGAKPPLVCLHGGPGAPHQYMLDYLRLLDSGHPIIFYDQVGCGKSTLLKEEEYKPLWVEKTFIEEMEALVAHLQLKQVIWVGHSWAHHYSILHPSQVAAIVSWSGMQDAPETAIAIRSRLPQLPPDVQKVIHDAEEAEKYDSEEYQKAVEVFFQEFVVDMANAPAWVVESVTALVEDQHVYLPMWGPSEFTPRGTMKNISLVPKVENITCPVLVIYGEQDEIRSSQETMVKRLVSSKNVVNSCIPGAKHIPTGSYMDEHIREVRKFLNSI